MRQKKNPPPPAPARLGPPLLAWFAAHARDLPWRRTRDPYAIWVSEIMLQQTQVKTVIPYWERWLRELPTVKSLAAAPEEKVLKLWEGLGYYTRARNLQKAAQLIVTRRDASFPQNFADVLALPGVGRYTAGAIASLAFNQPAPVLDGNVMRVLTRLFGIAENPREKTANEKLWRLAGELVRLAATVPFTALNSRLIISGPCSALNQSLMELGALVCTPRQPRCLLCPVAVHCVARQTGRIEQLPNLGKRAASTNREFLTVVIRRAGHYLVRLRPPGAVNAGFWEFPNVETAGTPAGPAQFVRATAGAKPVRCGPLMEIRHAITRYRMVQRVFIAEIAAKRSKGSGVWRPLADLEKLPFTAAHKKILGRLRHDLAMAETNLENRKTEG